MREHLQGLTQRNPAAPGLEGGAVQEVVLPEARGELAATMERPWTATEADDGWQASS